MMAGTAFSFGTQVSICVYFAGLESFFLSLTGLVATWATFDSEGRFKVLHKLLGGHLTWGGSARTVKGVFVWLRLDYAMVISYWVSSFY